MRGQMQHGAFMYVDRNHPPIEIEKIDNLMATVINCGNTRERLCWILMNDASSLKELIPFQNSSFKQQPFSFLLIFFCHLNGSELIGPNNWDFHLAIVRQ